MVEAELGSTSVVSRNEDGSVEVELSVVNVGAFRSWIFGLLDHAVVVSPESLRAEVVGWLGDLVPR